MKEKCFSFFHQTEKSKKLQIIRTCSMQQAFRGVKLLSHLHGTETKSKRQNPCQFKKKTQKRQVGPESANHSACPPPPPICPKSGPAIRAVWALMRAVVGIVLTSGTALGVTGGEFSALHWSCLQPFITPLCFWDTPQGAARTANTPRCQTNKHCGMARVRSI